MWIYEDRVILIYCCVLAAVFGAVLGSFLNCAAWRIAHGQSFLRGRSHCPQCGHVLGIADLVPIGSWLCLGGKCRYCKESIPARYPVSEALFAALTVACLLQFGLSVLFVRNLIFLCCLFCLALVDLECYIIPDGCLILAAAAWAVAIPPALSDYGGWHGILLHLLAAVVYGGGMLGISLVMDRMLQRESLGGGDIKLFAVMGLYLGLAASMFALLLACILGLAFGLVRKTKETKSGAPFPFGPAIALASAGMLLYGSPVVEWYLDLL